MAGLAAVLPYISAAATAAGTIVAAQGQRAAGRAAQQEANYEAAQLDIKAKEEQAAAQRDAEQFQRKKDLALSKLQTNAAASGFSATDPTALALADEISRYGTYQEQLAMYGGTSRAAGIDAQAAGQRFTGAAQRAGANIRAASTILGGVTTLADRFAPKPSTTSGNYRYG